MGRAKAELSRWNYAVFDGPPPYATISSSSSSFFYTSLRIIEQETAKHF